MAQTGFTPIKIYSSPTTAHVPLNTDLAAGELAINTFDGKLFYKDSSNVVQVIATKASATGTVSSVSALTLDTTGTDLSSTVANGTTTPVITLNVPTASATNRGVLSSADWSLFNGKGSGNGTVTNVTFTGGIVTVATGSTTPAFTVAGTSGGIPYFSSGSTWATSSALVASALMIGGGAGAAPSTTTTGTGVVTALGTNVGSAGAVVVNGGVLGTPSSGTLTNCTFPTLNQSTTGTADNAKAITNAGGWSITPSGTKLFFSYNSVNVGSLDSLGNLLVLGNVTAFAASV